VSGRKGPKGWYTIIFDDGTSIRSREASLCKPIGSARGPGRVRGPTVCQVSISERDSGSESGCEGDGASSARTRTGSGKIYGKKKGDVSQSSARVVDFEAMTSPHELLTVSEFKGIPTVPELDFREVGLPGLWRLPDR